MMLLRHDESIARTEMEMRLGLGYLPQSRRYAGATRCWAVYETEWMPATIRSMDWFRYVA
jgi:hypothetical protein